MTITPLAHIRAHSLRMSSWAERPKGAQSRSLSWAQPKEPASSLIWHRFWRPILSVAKGGRQNL